MKRIILFAAMIFIFFPKVFADEDININKKCYFPWQLYNYYKGNNSSIFLSKFNFGNNFINKNIFNGYNEYMINSMDVSFFDHIYSLNKTLGDYLYFQYQIVEFIDNITGGPERRRNEELENNRRYNILHPTEPLR